LLHKAAASGGTADVTVCRAERVLCDMRAARGSAGMHVLARAAHRGVVAEGDQEDERHDQHHGHHRRGDEAGVVASAEEVGALFVGHAGVFVGVQKGLHVSAPGESPEAMRIYPSHWMWWVRVPGPSLTAARQRSLISCLTAQSFLRALPGPGANRTADAWDSYDPGVWRARSASVKTRDPLRSRAWCPGVIRNTGRCAS
jgi:hypothetical protein